MGECEPIAKLLQDAETAFLLDVNLAFLGIILFLWLTANVDHD